MNAVNIRELEEAFGSLKPPTVIWQEPFDYIRGHCERIVEAGYDADWFDLSEYFLDYNYMKVQKDLLTFVLPIALNAWKRNLLSKNPTGHFENMWQAFEDRSLYPGYITAHQFEAVKAFLTGAMISRMNAEGSLHHIGYASSVSQWMSELMSLIYIMPVAENIWAQWWTLEENWQAICGLQWWSGFLFRTNDSPIFGSYSTDTGGGNSCPYDTEHLKRRPAHSTNIDFLKSAMTPDTSIETIKRCCIKLNNTQYGDIAGQILSSLNEQTPLLIERISKFLTLLQLEDGHRVVWWSDIPDQA